jgi:hypothetical protein
MTLDYETFRVGRRQLFVASYLRDSIRVRLTSDPGQKIVSAVRLFTGSYPLTVRAPGVNWGTNDGSRGIWKHFYAPFRTFWRDIRRSYAKYQQVCLWALPVRVQCHCEVWLVRCLMKCLRYSCCSLTSLCFWTMFSNINRIYADLFTANFSQANPFVILRL